MAADSMSVEDLRRRATELVAAIERADTAIKDAIAFAEKLEIDADLNDLPRFGFEVTKIIEGIAQDLGPQGGYAPEDVARDARDLIDLIDLGSKPGRRVVIDA